MWCRVVLLIIALTCTFQREIKADTDDLLCVLILSGIQKDDIDANLLKNLQRHNVNIDDLNNRKTIENCFMNTNSESSDKNGTVPTTEIMSTVNDQSIPIKTHLRTYVMNSEIEEISNSGNRTGASELENSNKTNTLHEPKLLNLWITYNRLNHDNGDKLTEGSRKGEPVLDPINYEREAKIVSQANDLALFHKMIENYIPIQYAITTELFTTEKSFDTVSQQFLKYLNNEHIHQNKPHIRLSGDTQPKAINTSKVIEHDQIEDTFKKNEYELKFNTSESNNNMDTRKSPNYENLIDLWITFNKTNDRSDNVDETAKKNGKSLDTHPPIPLINFQPPDQDIFNRMLNYIGFQQGASTTERTTTSRYKKADIVSQQIKKILQSNNVKHEKMLDFLQASKEAAANKFFDTNQVKNDDEYLTYKSHSNVADHLTNISEKPKFSKIALQVLEKTSEVNIAPESKYIEMLKAFIVSKSVLTTTQQPTTTPKHIDKILQEIKEFLENNGTNQNTVRQTNVNIIHKINDKNKLTAPNAFFHNYDMFPKRNVSESLRNLKIDQANVNMQSPKLSIKFSDDINIDSYSKDLDHVINSTKPAETTISASMIESKEIETIAQKVKEYLEKNNKYKKAIIRRDRESINYQKVSSKINDSYNKPITRRVIDINSNVKVTQKNARDTNDLIEAPDKGKIKGATKTGTVTGYQQIPENIIKEISEKVRATVLKDLQKHIPSTMITTTKETTIETTTKVTSVIVNRKLINKTIRFQRIKKETGAKNYTAIPRVKTTTNQPSISKIKSETVKPTTNDLAEFLELFQQFKNIKDSITATTNLRRTSEQIEKPTNEYLGEINVVYPSILPVHYNNSQSVSVYDQPFYVNPYHGLHTNKPIIQQTKITNEIREIAYGVPLPNMKHPASIIQTDAVQVPLLGIPVPNSIIPINQNIVVTTENPIVQYRKEYDHKLHIRQQKFDDDFLVRRHRIYDTSTKRLSARDYERMSDTEHIATLSDTEMDRYSYADIPRYHAGIERSFGAEPKYISHSRYHRHDYKMIPDLIRHPPRSRKATMAHDFYQVYLDDINQKHDHDHHPILSQEHKKERFHEKLERPDEWPNNPPKARQTITPKEDKKVKVASRQQISLNEFKEKKKLYDGAHFFNFLQRQKQVNDMLETILAQKSDKMRSVETPYTTR